VSLRKITLLVVGLTFLGLVVFLTFALETSLLRHFIRVEEQMVYISVQRAVGVINGELDYLLSTAIDWSERSEVVQFVQQPDDAIVQEYLSTRTLADLKANLVVFTDDRGTVLYSRGYDRSSQVEEALSPALLAVIQEANPLMLGQSTRNSGLLQTEGGPLMIASSSIWGDRENQTRVGTVVIGRYLTSSEILRLSGIIQMPITVEVYNSPNLKTDFLTAKQMIGSENTYVALPLEEDQIGGYAIVNDIFDRPAYLVNVQQRRVIYQNGQLLMRYLIIALLAAGMIFGISSMYILETLVLSRLTRLSREVNEIGASGELNRRVTVERHDELSSLSDNINHMLTILEQTRETENRLQQSLSQRLEEQDALYESSKIFLSQIDKIAHLKNICQMAVDRFCLDSASIYELDREEDVFILAAASGNGVLEERAHQLPLQEPAAAANPLMQCYQRQEAVIARYSSHSVAALPLLRDDVLFAALVLHSSEPDFFSTDRIQTLQAFANLSGMALRNAGLFEQVRSGQQRMESLSRRLVEVQEEERKYIAMELHDEIGQILTGLRLLLNLNIPGADQKVVESLQQSKDLVNELIVRVRQMSLELRPGLLDDLGLLPALLWHFEGYTRTTGIQVHFQHTQLEGKRFSFNIETTAYRVIQEALTNAARYANVKEISVWTGVLEDKLMIEISDQGAGFDMSQLTANGKSRGLLGMRERVKFVGGRVKIQSTQGKGTEINIQIPLEQSIEKEIS
jgi:signal transduction histidine kinase